MRNETLAALACAAVALVLGAAAATAQPPAPEGHGGRGPRMDRAEGMARFLGLSEPQKEQVRQLMDDRRAEHEALRGELEKNQDQLRTALESASPDPAVVGELAIEGHRLHEQGRALREAQDKAIRALLTAEQQVKFDAMKARREQGPGGAPPMGRGPMGPGGAEGWRP
jgi:Spy/CpxP family protein refolding chaperone